MSYYINFERFTIERLKEWIQSADLIPSWIILKDHLTNLNVIKKSGINNLEQLEAALKNKVKIQEFASESGLPEDYLTVLKRVISGFHPKPNKIKDFPEMNRETIEKLEEIGVTNTLKLYDHINEPSKREGFSVKMEMGKSEVDKLWKLTDLSRIKWVNHTFATVLMEAGYDSTEKVANADYLEMYERIKQLNKERGFYKGTIGANDMKRCAEAAQMLDFELEQV